MGSLPPPPPPEDYRKLFNSGLHDHTNPESFETAHFFSRFGWDSTTGMVIKTALCLELFRFLQFVVTQDKTSPCSSSSQLHSPRGGSTALARLGLFARSTKTAMLRAGYKFIFFCHSLQRWGRHCSERWQRHGSMQVRESTTFRECNTLQLTS